MIGISQKAAVPGPALQVVAVVAVRSGGHRTAMEDLAGLHATGSIASVLGVHGTVPSRVMDITPNSSCSFYFPSTVPCLSVCVQVPIKNNVKE